MKRLAQIAALTFGAFAAVQAAADPIESLEECYNTVITWCEETFPDQAGQCGNISALSECDEVFGTANANPGAVFEAEENSPIARLRVVNLRPLRQDNQDNRDPYRPSEENNEPEEVEEEEGGLLY